MPIAVWTPTSTWAPAKTVHVWPSPEVGWTRAKKVKVWNGSAWILSWVHPVTNAALSLSKAGVNVSESYNVILTAPDGFPDGAAVTFRRDGFSQTVNAVEGAVSVTLTSQSHSASGTYLWYADVTTKGGNTSFGPVTQSVAIVSTSVTLTAPAWAFSESQSGSGGSKTIAQAAFSITLSNPAVVSTLSFQIAFPDYQGGEFYENASWTNPTSITNHSVMFNTPGVWRARAVVTQIDTTVIYSAEKSFTVYKKSLTASASPVNPVSTNTVTLTAGHTGDAVGQITGAWGYMRPGDGIWHDNWQTGNPSYWAPGAADNVYFRWVETYADGSTIRSNEVHSVVTVNAISTQSGEYNGVPGGTGLIDAMRAARSANLPLHVYGTWNLSLDEIWIPDGVTVVCQPGVKFNHTPVARFKNAAKWPATTMPNSCGGYDGGTFHWTGGEFNGNGDGVFTISHSPGFTITGATIYNWAAGNEDGHGIEINSSGGNDLYGAAYTVQITNNSFLGTTGQRSNGNDEACHYDWAYKGSGCGGAEDHTMCQNVRIAGNTFHRYSEGWGGYLNGGFALTGVGGHRMGDEWKGLMGNAGIANPSDGEPSGRHNSFLIENNGFHASVGATAGVSPNKGAIALWNLRDTIVRNNNFYSCTAGRLVSAWDKTKNLNTTGAGNVNISVTGCVHNGAAEAVTMPASNTTGG